MTTVLAVTAPIRPAAAGLLRRPKSTTGFWSWWTTVDHKKIAILYGGLALVFFLVAGIEALLIRLQLAGPNGTVLTASQYNTLFTMHGTTMVFLVGMPLATAFGNYLIPLQIGARDVAFPRLNMFGFWVFAARRAVHLLGLRPRRRAERRLVRLHAAHQHADDRRASCPGHGPDFWAVGLVMLGIGSVTSGVNFVVTILNMRAPGMTLMRMPVFVWMMLVVAFLTVFAMPAVTAALIMVFFDRNFSTNFFVAAAGGDPLLYQHLFWLFGHPEVYILILPGMGIVSEILPVFSRKPLFGYARSSCSPGIAIGFLGWGVWAHHMFATGLGPVAIYRVRPLDDAHRDPDRREDLQLARHGVGRVAAAQHSDAVLARLHRDVHDRWTLGRHALDRARRHAADRHLLRRRALPLRALRRSGLRDLRRLLLLVAEGLRADARRPARQGQLLADADRVQPHVLPDAHPRARRVSRAAPTGTPRTWAGTP